MNDQLSPAVGYLHGASNLYEIAAHGMAIVLWLLAGLLTVAVVGYIRNRDP